MPPPTLAHDRAHDDFDDAVHWIAEPFDAGARMCPPSTARRGSTLLPAALAVAVVSGGAWSYVRFPEAWSRVAAIATSVVQQPGGAPGPASDSTPVQPTVASRTLGADAALPPAREVAAAPGHDAGTPVAGTPVAPAAAEASPAASETPPQSAVSPAPPEAEPERQPARPEPLAKPTVDPSNPHQKRAFAVGLHPDLSEAVLKRLTGADFKNASIAITKALSASPDGAAVSWPAARTPADKLALFEVRFVASSAPDCRRYVVTVTLDRWSSTAPAMEKCGAELPRPRLRASTG